MASDTFPQTLQQAVLHFSDPENCRAEMVRLRWPDGVVKCPTCGSAKVSYLKSRKVYECGEKPRHAKRQFSLKVGTIMEDSALGMDKWLIAMWLITSCKNGISSYELKRAIDVEQRTAWFMLHRIRVAMQSETEKFDGHVEVDETFIGGSARFMHKAKRERVMKGHKAGQWNHKTAVVGAIQRGRNGEPSQAVVRVIPDTRRKTVMPFVNEHVSRENSVLYTDALKSYEQPPVSPWTGQPVSEGYEHQAIDHAIAYVQGDIHTNSAENFWSLVKRMLRGTYISVEPFHLFRYLDEQTFRFNTRKMSDAARFARAAASVFGKRLTYNKLTGAGVSL